MIRSLLRNLSLLLFLFAIIAPFNNCTYVDSLWMAVDQASVHSQLSVQVAGNNSFTIPATMGRFSLSGKCNPDIYPQNVIWWTIEDKTGGTYKDVWNSYTAGGKEFLTTCKNGSFSSTVVVPCLNGGVACTGLKQNYRMRMHISGLSTQGKSNGLIANSADVTLSQ